MTKLKNKTNIKVGMYLHKCWNSYTKSELFVEQINVLSNKYIEVIMVDKTNNTSVSTIARNSARCFTINDLRNDRQYSVDEQYAEWTAQNEEKLNTQSRLGSFVAMNFAELQKMAEKYK